MVMQTCGLEAAPCLDVLARTGPCGGQGGGAGGTVPGGSVGGAGAGLISGAKSPTPELLASTR